MSTNLILHWMLDRLGESNNVADETANHLDGTYAGNPTVVPDAKFGSCLYFDGAGDSVTVPDSTALRLKNYTVEVWIKPEQTNDWQSIVGKPGRNYNIRLDSAGYIHHRFHVGTDVNTGAPDTPNGSIAWSKWNHVAITNDGDMARTYIDGILAAEGPVGGELIADSTAFIVGRDLDDTQNHSYKGCMAHIRLYDDALSIEEIRRDMQQDEAAAAAFVRSHPIGFDLYNEDNHHVLYIDDHPEGQTLSLNIVNTSTKAIELNNFEGTATPEKHHFELRFRPETLADANFSQIQVATEGWSLDRLHRPGQVLGTSLYLLHQGKTILEKGEIVNLQLTGMNADGRGGTRGTRVELIAKNIQFSGEETLLEDTRLQYLNIVNHRGRRNLPLHVGLVGANTVLSDGSTPNILRIRIANLSRDFSLSLSKGDATTAPSRFRISFDVQEEGETREWALMSHGDVNGVSLHVTQTHGVSSNWADPEKRNLGQTVEWTVTPGEDTTLGADGYIILEFRDLVSLASIGHANIYINFENIPGYQDQQMTIAVQKSPLLYSNSHIGIGTNTPEAKLQVINTNQSANGNTLILGPTNQSNLRLGYHQNYSWIQSHGGKPLAINPIGSNVGIGKDNPQEKLEVNGNIKLSGNGKKLELIEAVTARGSVAWGSLEAESYVGLTIGFPDKAFGGKLKIGTWSTDREREFQELMRVTASGNVGIGTDNPGSYKLNVEGGNTRLGGLLHIQRDAILERENDCHLEIFSPNTNDTGKYTKIRFHQGNQYWAWLGYHGIAQNDTGEFVFWNLNQNKEAKVRVGDLSVNGEISSKQYQFSADNKWQSQQINASGKHVIQLTKRNDPFNIYNDALDRFEAPTSGYYFFSANITFTNGNGSGDGVIVGIYRNGDVNDMNTTIIVLEPGKFTTGTAQSITAMMNLNQGDSVDLRLEGVDNSRFLVYYCSFMGYMLSK